MRLARVGDGVEYQRPRRTTSAERKTTPRRNSEKSCEFRQVGQPPSRWKGHVSRPGVKWRESRSVTWSRPLCWVKGVGPLSRLCARVYYATLGSPTPLGTLPSLHAIQRHRPQSSERGVSYPYSNGSSQNPPRQLPLPPTDTSGLRRPVPAVPGTTLPFPLSCPPLPPLTPL